MISQAATEPVRRPDSGSIEIHPGESKRNFLIDNIEKYSSLTISSLQWSNIRALASGTFDPLTGFVNSVDYRSIISSGRLADGTTCNVAIPLLAEDEDARDLQIDEDIVLRDNNGKNIAMLHLSEKFLIDQDQFALHLRRYGNSSKLRDLAREGNIALAGPVDIIRMEDAGPAQTGESR